LQGVGAEAAWDAVFSQLHNELRMRNVARKFFLHFKNKCSSASQAKELSQ
jgi:hypothetical protein